MNINGTIFQFIKNLLYDYGSDHNELERFYLLIPRSTEREVHAFRIIEEIWLVYFLNHVHDYDSDYTKNLDELLPHNFPGIAKNS